jgi:hypothetical protein
MPGFISITYTDKKKETTPTNIVNNVYVSVVCWCQFSFWDKKKSAYMFFGCYKHDVLLSYSGLLIMTSVFSVAIVT